MAQIDKQPTLEPVQYDDKNPVAAIFMFLSILIWALGGVVTVFAILAMTGVGTFADIFVDVFPEGIQISHIIGIAVGVFMSGLSLMTVCEGIRLLQRKATTVYAIRGLDQVIPRKVELDGFDPEIFQGIAEKEEPSASREENEENGLSRRLDASGIRIIVNVNPQAGAVPVSVTTQTAQEEAQQETAALAEPEE